MSDLKTSLLVNRQVPEFIREEYPLFITFLEAYYEFLEQKQGTEINDLTAQAKQLRYLADVDESIASFESNFFNGMSTQSESAKYWFLSIKASLTASTIQ